MLKFHSQTHTLLFKIFNEKMSKNMDAEVGRIKEQDLALLLKNQ